MNIPTDKCPFCKKNLIKKDMYVSEIDKDKSINNFEFFCNNNNCFLKKYTTSRYAIETYRIKNSLSKTICIKRCNFIIDDIEIELRLDKNITFFYDLIKDMVAPCLEFNKLINFDFSSEDKLKEKIKTILLFS